MRLYKYTIHGPLPKDGIGLGNTKGVAAANISKVLMATA